MPPDTSTQPGRKPFSMFLSYSHKDKRFRDDLTTHISLMLRQGLITSWNDRNISAGDEWAREIDEHLDTANIILLLISADFLASDYCYDLEMQRAMQRHERHEARVIPVILRPCQWHEAPFGKLQALPRDGRPITSWNNRDEALFSVVQELRRVIEELQKRA